MQHQYFWLFLSDGTTQLYHTKNALTIEEAKKLFTGKLVKRNVRVKIVSRLRLPLP